MAEDYMKNRHRVTSQAMTAEEKRQGQTFGEAFANDTMSGRVMKAALKVSGVDLDAQRVVRAGKGNRKIPGGS